MIFARTPPAAGRFGLCFCLFWLALFAAAPLSAQGLFGSRIVTAELRPGWQTEDGTVMAALHLRLAEGWKTYWRIPGEAGIAPQMDWSRSQNLDGVRAHWPLPIVFDQSGYRSIGYADELVLPLEFTPRRAGRPMAIQGDITIGVCRETCVPVDLTLSVALRGPGAHDPLIAQALARGARTAQEAGLSRARCALTPTERGMEVTLRATLPRSGRGEHVVIELPGSGYWVSDARSWREGGDLLARSQIRDPARGPVMIERSALAFTVISETQMLTAEGCEGG
jgi:DsbC/DsbD-like thiol-disulfide interchange protein